MEELPVETQNLKGMSMHPYKIKVFLDHNGAVSDFIMADTEFETVDAARLYIKKQFDDTITNLENANTSYTVSCIANKDSIDIPRGYQQDYESVFYKKLFTDDFTMIMEIIR